MKNGKTKKSEAPEQPKLDAAGFRRLCREMTLRQKKFADLFLKCGNGTEAYMAAGYDAGDEHAAGALASRMLANDRVSQYVAYRAEKMFDRLEIDTENIKREIAACAFSNIGDYAEINEAGAVQFKPFNELTMEQLSAVAEIGTNANGFLRMKLHSKLEALQKLGEHLHLFDKHIRVDQTVVIKEMGALSDSDLAALAQKVEDRQN